MIASHTEQMFRFLQQFHLDHLFVSPIFCEGSPICTQEVSMRVSLQTIYLVDEALRRKHFPGGQ